MCILLFLSSPSILARVFRNFCQRQPGCWVFHSFFGGEGCGGGWKRTREAGWKGAWIRFSGCFAFFSPPWLAPYQATFFFFFSNFLTTNERAVDAVVYPRPRTKAARNLRVAASHTFYFLSPPSMYDSTRHDTWGNLEGGPDEFQLYPLYLFPPGQANFTILFRARKRRIERGYDKVEILGLYKLEFFFSWKREFVARRLEKEGKKKGERKREISSGICLGEERFTRE